MKTQVFKVRVKKSKAEAFLKLIEDLDYVQLVDFSNDHIVKGSFKPGDKPSDKSGLLKDYPMDATTLRKEAWKRRDNNKL